MKFIRRTLYIFAFLTISPTVAVSQDIAHSANCANADYYSFDRLFVNRFFGDQFEFGQVYPEGNGNEISGAELISYDISHCSNDDFRCVKTVWGMYVVPRKFNAEIHSFTYSGATFRVLSCMRGTQSNCASAIVQADCALNNKAECSSKGDIGPTVGYRRLYYAYTQRVGITAISAPVTTKRAPRNLSREAARRELLYTLAGDCGILK
jgi:hypothetical protein